MEFGAPTPVDAPLLSPESLAAICIGGTDLDLRHRLLHSILHGSTCEPLSEVVFHPLFYLGSYEKVGIIRPARKNFEFGSSMQITFADDKYGFGHLGELSRRDVARQ